MISKRILQSIAILLSVAVIGGFAAKGVNVNFWIGFVVAIPTQFICTSMSRGAYHRFVDRTVDLIDEYILEDELRSSYNLICPCGHNAGSVQVHLNEENFIKCEKCKNVLQVNLVPNVVLTTGQPNTSVPYSIFKGLNEAREAAKKEELG